MKVQSFYIFKLCYEMIIIIIYSSFLTKMWYMKKTPKNPTKTKKRNNKKHKKKQGQYQFKGRK